VWTQPKAKELVHRHTLCPRRSAIKLRAFVLEEDVQPRTNIQPGLLQSKTAADSLGIVRARFVFRSLFCAPLQRSSPCVLTLGLYMVLCKRALLHLSLAGEAQPAVATATTVAGKRTSKQHRMLRSSRQRQPLLHCQRVAAWQRTQKLYPRRVEGGFLFACGEQTTPSGVLDIHTHAHSLRLHQFRGW
jgi:hypothetical protein